MDLHQAKAFPPLALGQYKLVDIYVEIYVLKE